MVPSNSGGICVQECYEDIDCSNIQLCCSNGCGHTCVMPGIAIIFIHRKPAKVFCGSFCDDISIFYVSFCFSQNVTHQRKGLQTKLLGQWWIMVNVPQAAEPRVLLMGRDCAVNTSGKCQIHQVNKSPINCRQRPTFGNLCTKLSLIPLKHRLILWCWWVILIVFPFSVPEGVVVCFL